MLKFFIATVFKLHYFAFLLLFIFSAPVLSGQAKTVLKSNQEWFQYYGQVKLDEHWSIQADAGFRWLADFKEPSQYIIRAGAKYALDEKIGLATGFAFLGGYSMGSLNRLEYRPYQEFSLSNKILNFSADQRFRIEERFLKSLANASEIEKNTFGLRLRYSLIFGTCLFSLSKSNPEQKMMLFFGDEVFLQFGKDANKTIFDQNRIIISPTLQLGKDLAISFTYNNQYSSTITPDMFNHTHVFWLQVRHKLSVIKKYGAAPEK